jgi:hypothetical protein
MLTKRHLLELRRKFYYTSSAFGGPENLIEILERTNITGIEVERQVYRILSHPGEVKVISPWGLVLDLMNRDYTGISRSDSILIKYPYGVYNSRGEILYKVKNHNGYFGLSSLDKTLVLQSKTGEMFYLRYSSIEGEMVVLLIVNNLALENAYPNVISDRDFIEPPPLRDEQSGFNFERPAIEPFKRWIRLNTSSLTSKSNILVHQLIGSPTVIPSIEQLITNTQVVTEEILIDKEIIIYLKKSGWLCMRQGNNLCVFDNLTGEGVDRVIEAKRGIYYIAVGDEIKTSINIRQELGLVSRVPVNLSTDDSISLVGGITYA